MDSFDLFHNALKDVEETTNGEGSKPEHEEVCCHENIIYDNGVKICEDCGAEIVRDISYNKEWRYYGSSDTKHNSDPSRCQKRKSDEKNIYKDVEGMNFGDKIIIKANSIYEEVTANKIYRGNSRKAIVFACIFHAYKLQGTPQSCENLVKIFNLERKIGLKGLKHVSLNLSKDSEIRKTYISAEDLIKEIMKKFDANDTQIQEVIDIYGKVQNKSSILNRSRPQSVASGLVRYYINITQKEIPMEDFRQKIGLSELTINRIVKEIDRIVKENEEILT